MQACYLQSFVKATEFHKGRSQNKQLHFTNFESDFTKFGNIAETTVQDKG